MAFAPLQQLQPGMMLIFGDRIFTVPEELAAEFEAGDRLVPVPEFDEVLRVPQAAQQAATTAVDAALEAFEGMRNVSNDAITRFFERCAESLRDDVIWSEIEQVNETDVENAKARGRSTTRLKADATTREKMIEGLLAWARAPSRRSSVQERIEHTDWTAELVGSPLGIVGFVFEGRPNVVVDATGVLRGGNTVVYRIGRDALETARTIMRLVVRPSLVHAGLPENAVGLVDDPSHASGWALFSDPRLALAVARGSGKAVQTLASLARRAGINISCHGTGGAWIVAGASANPSRLAQVIERSLDRKVCNTVNVCCVPPDRAKELVPVVLEALARAGGEHGFKLHVAEGAEHRVPAELFQQTIAIERAEGWVTEPQAQRLPITSLGHEWEWEKTPEITLCLASVFDAIALFNRYSPRFVASLISDDPLEHERFFGSVDAPFVSDDHTRWVDGQVCLNRPELGLSNWQLGRLFGRGGILTGDDIYTLRTRRRSK